MERTGSADRLTVIAIAVIAYALVNVCHEIIGHCTMAVFAGTKCAIISSTNIPLATEIPSWKYKFIVLPAGCIANWTAGLVCLFILRTWQTAKPTVRYFLWLSVCVNLFLASTYVTVAPIIKFGDSYIFIQDFSNQLLWRSAVVLAGAGVWWLSFRLCRRELIRLIGFRGREAKSLAWELVAPAYLSGGIVTVTSALFSQLDWKVAQLQAAGGTFGLTIWLLLLPFTIPETTTDLKEPFVLPRSWLWIVAGALTAAIFVGVLGHGIAL